MEIDSIGSVHSAFVHVNFVHSELVMSCALGCWQAEDMQRLACREFRQPERGCRRR